MEAGGEKMISPWFLLMVRALCFPLHLSGMTGSFPRPLSTEEERACLERYAAGDLAARDKLIEHNLRLVAHIVKKGYPSRKLFLAGYRRNEV